MNFITETDFCWQPRLLTNPASMVGVGAQKTKCYKLDNATIKILEEIKVKYDVK